MTKFKFLTALCLLCCITSIQASAQRREPVPPPPSRTPVRPPAVTPPVRQPVTRPVTPPVRQPVTTRPGTPPVRQPVRPPAVTTPVASPPLQTSNCCKEFTVDCLSTGPDGIIGDGGAVGGFLPQICRIQVSASACIAHGLISKDKDGRYIIYKKDHPALKIKDCVFYERKLREEFYKKYGAIIAKIPNPLPIPVPDDLAAQLEKINTEYIKMTELVNGCTVGNHELTHAHDGNCTSDPEPLNPAQSAPCRELTALIVDAEALKGISTNACNAYLDGKKDPFSAALCATNCVNLYFKLLDVQQASFYCKQINNKCDLSVETCGRAFINCVFKNKEIANQLPAQCKSFFDLQEKPDLLTDLLNSATWIKRCQDLIYNGAHNCKYYIGVDTNVDMNPPPAPLPPPQDPQAGLQTRKMSNDIPTVEQLTELVINYPNNKDFGSCPAPVGTPVPGPNPMPNPTPVKPPTSCTSPNSAINPITGECQPKPTPTPIIAQPPTTT